MVKLVDKQNIFNSGIISSKLYSRTDLKQFNNGVADAFNFVCSRFGPIEKRTGTMFSYDLSQIEDTNSAGATSFWLPFIYNIKQALLLEFRVQTIGSTTYRRVYFYKFNDKGELGAVSRSTTDLTPYYINHTFTEEQVKGLSYVQSLDVIYLAIPGGETPPHKLVRRADNNWELSVFESEDGPYLDQNYDTDLKVQIVDKNTDNSWVAFQGFDINSTVDAGRWIRINTPRYNANSSAYEDRWSYGKITATSAGHPYAFKIRGAVVYTAAETPAVDEYIFSDKAKKHKIAKITSVNLTGEVSTVVAGGVTYIYDGITVTGSHGWTRDNVTYFGNKPVTQLTTSDSLYTAANGGNAVPIASVSPTTGVVTITVSGVNYPCDAVGRVYQVAWKYRFYIDEGDNSWMTSPTTEWRLGVWRARTGNSDYPVTYPTKVCIHQQRLVWGGVTSEKPWVWLSNSFAYKNYATTDYEGVVSDARAIYADISTDKVSEIFWMKSAKNLLVGTELGEIRIHSSGIALTPSDHAHSLETSYGSYNAEPVVTEDTIVFIQRLQRTLRALAYDDNSNAFVGPELTILAEDLTAKGIKKLVFQKEPNNTFWCLMENGTLLSLTYDRSQEVIGWSKSMVAGEEARVVDLAVLPSAVTQQDTLILIVERKIAGQTLRYLETLSRNFTEEVSAAEACFLDCTIKIQSEEAGNIITGLEHLIGQKVRVMEDGAIVGDYVVDDDGVITLDQNVNNVLVGLPYEAYFETLERDFQDKQISTQMSKLRVYDMKLYLVRSLGLTVQRLQRGTAETLTTFDPSGNMDTAPATLTGKFSIKVPSAWDQDYRLKIVSEPGMPCTVAGITQGVEINAT